MDTKDMTTRDTEFHTELFGGNTYIFSPEDDPKQVAETLDAIYEKQEANQFGEERYAIYFMPGEYDETIEANVGFYTQVAGLGVCNAPQDGFQMIRQITMHAVISGAE